MNIISRKPLSIIIESGQEIPYNLGNWPEKSPGQPYRKSEVLWDGSKVVLKTQAQLGSDEAAKALPATDAKMPRALEDHVDLLISKGLVSIKDYPEKFQEIYNLKKELRSQIL